MGFMFLLDPLHPIFNAVMTAVAKKPGITIADLHTVLKRRKVDTSLQHLYRTVGRLVEAQILLKNGKELSLNSMWLSYIQYFGDQAKEALSEAKMSDVVFPLKEGQRKSYDAHTLLEVQTIWNHTLVQLHRAQREEKYLFKFYSHAWWQVGKHALDLEFYRTIKKKGVGCYWLFGHETYLDTQAMTALRDVAEVRSTETPPFPEEGYCLNVYGDYVIECVFPENVAKHLGFFFHGVTSDAQFDESILDDILVQDASFKVTIWRNAKQAAALRAKIMRYFLKTGA
jgi:hypothetical protein